MAEIAVNLVMGKLIPLLRYEVTLLKEVHTQVAFIKDQLGLIRAYLRDADMKADKEDKSDVVKEWVKQVREVAHRIEDVIDEYLLQVAQRRQKRGLAGVVEKIARLLRSIEPHHEITSKIRDINTMIASLDRRKETLGFNPTTPESSTSGYSQGAKTSAGTGHDIRTGALFLDDANLEGFDDTRKKLKSLLLDEDCTRTVIAVVGTGGFETTVNLVIDKLIPLRRDEVNLLRNVHGQIMSIKDQLQLMWAYPRDADAKAELTNTDDLVKEWVRQMRQVSCRIEDVTNEYLSKVKQRRRPNRGGAVAVVCKICDLFRTVKPRHEFFSSQIGDITQSIERLNKARETFGFNPSAPESRSHGGAESSIDDFILHQAINLSGPCYQESLMILSPVHPFPMLVSSPCVKSSAN